MKTLQNTPVCKKVLYFLPETGHKLATYTDLFHNLQWFVHFIKFSKNPLKDRFALAISRPVCYNGIGNIEHSGR